MSNIGNQYEIIQKIGEGGMGIVYLATDKMLDRQVAIKQLNHSSGIVDEHIGDRFQQEALALARLNHPNITHLYALVPKDDTYWMVMEYVEGKTLEEWLRIHKKITHNLAASIAVQMLDGLYHAHRKGIIHRDIKPANVMINEEGEVKIMDFGIARMRNAQRITRHGKSVGTLEYMAPEQIQGQEGDERTDIYAVGNILYELLCGIPPFQSDTDFQLMKDKLEKQPASIAYFNPAVPIALQRIVFKALDRSPEKRYQSAAELKQTLEKSLDGALLTHDDLTRVLKASQVITEPQVGNEVMSVTGLLARAQRLSGRIKVPGTFSLNKAYSPYLILAASVIVCVLLLVWNNADDETPPPQKKNNDVAWSSPDNPTNSPDEYATSGDKSFEETPGEMYRRIANQPKEAVRSAGTVEATRPTSPKKTPQPARSSEETARETETRTSDMRTVSRQPVDVPAGKIIHVTLAEDISSENEALDGSQIRLTCNDNVLADDRIIIRKGAQAVGKIVDVIPSSNKRKKALVGFIILQVQAVDGSMIKLHSDRFRLFADEPGRPVSYKKGQSFQAELKKGRVR